jgi:hypothetical protein
MGANTPSKPTVWITHELELEQERKISFVPARLGAHALKDESEGVVWPRRIMLLDTVFQVNEE